MTRSLPTIDTALVHAGEPEPPYAGAVAMPVFQSATCRLEQATDFHDIRYIRLNNTPNHLVLHALFTQELHGLGIEHTSIRGDAPGSPSSTTRSRAR